MFDLVNYFINQIFTILDIINWTVHRVNTREFGTERFLNYFKKKVTDSGLRDRQELRR